LTAAAISDVAHAGASLTVLRIVENFPEAAGAIVTRKTKDIPATEPAGDGFLIAGLSPPPVDAPKGYIVLARRYRSRNFSELIGQESIARTLQNAISMGRTAHAYLFCGTRGVGKTSMARVFARALNATSDLQQAEAVANSILRGEDLDVIEIDGASHRGVDDARDLISKAGIAPARCPYRIYIIDEVHMLTTPAFNALLKTMEEPPSHVKFILCTTEPHKVPATIQSRCQRFDFKPIATNRIMLHLQSVLQRESVEAEEAAVHLVARLGNGSMRDALSLLDRLIASASGKISMRLAEETLGLPDAALITAVLTAVVAGDAKAGLIAGARLLESGCPIEQSLELLASRLRDVMVLRTCGAESDLVELSPDARAQAAEQAAQFQAEEWVHLIAVCEAALRAAKSTNTPRTVFDATLARLCLHRSFESIDAVSSATSMDEKKKVVESFGPPRAVVPARTVPVAVTQFTPPTHQQPPTSAPLVSSAQTPTHTVAHNAAQHPVHNAAPLSAPAPRDIAEAWSRITALALAPREAAMTEALEPVSIDGQLLRLRVCNDAGLGGAFAARRIEPLQELVRRALGVGWRVLVDAPREIFAPATASAHGLDSNIANHPLVREAMESFDAIIMKVEPRIVVRTIIEPVETAEREGDA